MAAHQPQTHVSEAALRHIQNAIRMKSGLITGIIVAIFVAALVFKITIIKTTTPPKEEDEFQMVGRIDFGNFTEGSMNVNNFKPPTPNPEKDAKPKAEKAPKVDKTPPAENNTQEEESPVKETPKPIQENAKPTPKPTPVKSTPTATKSGQDGSNHGDKPGATGNRGTPKSTVLDDKGLYSLGDGIAAEGLGGRGLLNEFRPTSCGDCGESGKITFEVTIAPNGSVILVRAVRDPGVPHSKPLIMAALRRLKFDAVSGGGNQKVKITVNVKAE